MLCKRITVSDWDSWFGNSLHDSVKSIRCLIIFKTTILLLRLLKSAAPRCKRRLEEKEEEEEEERSTGGVFMEPVPLRAVATNPPDDDDKTTHTHTLTHTHRRVWVGTAPMHLYTGRSTRRTATDFANTSDDKLDIDASKQ